MSQNQKIVLGSASVGRRDILKQIIGDEFQILKADIDEKAIGDRETMHPSKLVVEIALKKAEAIIKKYPQELKGAILITSDEVVVYNGKIREKPESYQEARLFLESYRNSSVQCHTSLIVTNVDTMEQVVECDVASQYFSYISDEAINSLIEKGDVLYCAGGFTVEDELLKPFLTKRTGEEETIIGLPKTKLIEALKKFQYKF